jgi:hypothetical protein
MKRTERGFAVYTEFKDQYGANCRIVRSSLATGRCVWIQNEVVHHMGEHIGNAHLTVPMAKRVIKALQAFVDGKE